jgi:hypothetical protein
MKFCRSMDCFRGFCFTGVASGWIFRWCSITSLGSRASMTVSRRTRRHLPGGRRQARFPISLPGSHRCGWFGRAPLRPGWSLRGHHPCQMDGPWAPWPVPWRVRVRGRTLLRRRSGRDLQRL